MYTPSKGCSCSNTRDCDCVLVASPALGVSDARANALARPWCSVLSRGTWYHHFMLPLSMALNDVVVPLQEASREDDGFFIKDGIIVVTKGM